MLMQDVLHKRGSGIVQAAVVANHEALSGALHNREVCAGVGVHLLEGPFHSMLVAPPDHPSTKC